MDVMGQQELASLSAALHSTPCRAPAVQPMTPPPQQQPQPQPQHWRLLPPAHEELLPAAYRQLLPREKEQDQQGHVQPKLWEAEPAELSADEMEWLCSILPADGEAEGEPASAPHLLRPAPAQRAGGAVQAASDVPGAGDAGHSGPFSRWEQQQQQQTQALEQMEAQPRLQAQILQALAQLEWEHEQAMVRLIEHQRMQRRRLLEVHEQQLLEVQELHFLQHSQPTSSSGPHWEGQAQLSSGSSSLLTEGGPAVGHPQFAVPAAARGSGACLSS